MWLKRSSLFALPIGIYFLASALSFTIERWMPRLSSGQETLRITLRHFQQPKEWAITPQSLTVFLERVTDRTGGYAPPWVYVGLLAAYLILNLLLLVRLTQTVSMATASQPGQGVGLDFVLRYAPIVDRLSRCSADARILEIGPGIAGLAKLLDAHTVVGIDARSINPHVFPQNIKMIQASALSAPFSDSSFDYVVCVDVLEHLALADRGRLINEALRLTKDTLFLAAPAGIKAARAERCLYAVLAPLYRILRKDLSFLTEHIERGLPLKSDLVRAITASVPSTHVSVSRNVNLYVWMLFMGLDPFVRWATKHTGVAWLTRLLRPVAPVLSFRPSYRLVFTISKLAKKTPNDGNGETV